MSNKQISTDLQASPHATSVGQSASNYAPAQLGLASGAAETARVQSRALQGVVVNRTSGQIDVRVVLRTSHSDNSGSTT